MTTLLHVGIRTADEVPPVLGTHEVAGLLNGTLRAPTPAQVKDKLTQWLDDAEYERLFGRQHTPTIDLPDARIWVQRFAVALVECLSARRQPAQLQPYCEQDVMGRITRRYRAAARRGHIGGTTAVRRVRVCLPADGVVEAAVVARVNGRPTPIAMRLTGADGRWRVSVLEIL